MPSSAVKAAERRSALRYRCLGACVVRLVHRDGVGAAVSGLTYNLSRSGIGLALQKPLPTGTRVIVEKHGRDDARPLYATVVRSCQLAFAWFHGCRLGKPLTEDELHIWLK